MRFAWVLVMLLGSGCAGAEPAECRLRLFERADPMKGCAWLDETARSDLDTRVENYFLSEVSDVKRFEVERGYQCEKEFVIPITACVADGPLSQWWFVYISKADPADIRLGRPE